MRTRMVTLLVAAAAVAPIAAGCQPDTDELEVRRERCAAVFASREPSGTPAHVVVVDSSASMTANPASKEFTQAMYKASRAQQDARVVVTNGGSGKATAFTVPLSTTKEPSSRVRRLEAESAAWCVLDKAFRENPPTEPGTDLHSALVLASEGVSKASTVWLVSDGVATSGAWDLTKVKFPVEPGAVSKAWMASNPVDLKGATLHVSGLGASAPAVPTGSRTWLLELHRGLCAAMHAQGCDGMALSDSAGGERAEGTTVADPRVAFPGIRSVKVGADCKYELPGSVLFDANSASIRPAARESLRTIARKAATASMTTVVGHTANPPGAKASALVELSQQRADAVRQTLAAEGVPAARVKAVGKGAAEPVADDRGPDGQLREPEASRNRRVEIVVRGSSCGN